MVVRKYIDDVSNHLEVRLGSSAQPGSVKTVSKLGFRSSFKCCLPLDQSFRIVLARAELRRFELN